MTRAQHDHGRHSRARCGHQLATTVAQMQENIKKMQQQMEKMRTTTGLVLCRAP